METKHWIFLGICLAVLPVSTTLAVTSRKARDTLVVLMLLITTKPGTYDVNLFGREFYRAATRGVEISLIDVFAISLFVGCLLGRRPGVRKWVWPPALLTMLVFTIYCAVSVATSDPQLFGVYELTKIARGVFVFTAVATYVRSAHEVRITLLGVGLAMCYEGYEALSARYLHHAHRIKGTLGHPNNLAMYGNMCAALLGAATISDVSRKWRRFFLAAFLGAAASVVLTISRTGFAVLLLVCVMVPLSMISLRTLTRFRLRHVVIAFITLMGAVGVIWKASDSLMGRYEQASLEDEFLGEGKGRGMYFRLGALALADHPLGFGLNNWSWYVTRDYYPMLGFPSVPYENTDIDLSGLTSMDRIRNISPPAHNLFILTAGELGWPGLVIFLCIWLRWLQVAAGFFLQRSPDLVSRFGIGAFWCIVSLMLENLTEYGFRHSSIFFFIHVVAGALVGARFARKQELAAARRARRKPAPELPWSPSPT